VIARRLLPVTVALLAAAGLPASASAHGEAVVAPTFPGVLLAWSFDPLAIALIGAAALLYLRGVREVNAAHPRSPVSRAGGSLPSSRAWRRSPWRCCRRSSATRPRC
jgi:hypothetical protein